MKRFIMLLVCLAFVFTCLPALAKDATFFVADEVRYKRQDFRVTRVMQARECVKRVAGTWYTLRKKDVVPFENFAVRADDPLLTASVIPKKKKTKQLEIMDEVIYDGQVCTIRAIVQQEECAEDGWSVFTTYQITPASGQGQDVAVRQDANLLSLKLRRK